MLELIQKLHFQIYPGSKGTGAANKENQQRKPNFLERKRLVDYGGSGDLDEIETKSENKNKTSQEAQGTAAHNNQATVLATSNDNKKDAQGKKKGGFQLQRDDEDDEDDFDSEPWNHPNEPKRGPSPLLTGAMQPDRRELGGKQNPFDQKVKPAFDDLEDDDDWAFDQPKTKPKPGAPAASQKADQQQLSLGDLLKHQNESKRPAAAPEKDNGLIVDDDFADEFEEDEDGELEGLLDDKEDPPPSKAEAKTKAHDIFERNQEPQQNEKAKKPGEEDDQEKLILEQFQLIYEKDP